MLLFLQIGERNLLGHAIAIVKNDVGDAVVVGDGAGVADGIFQGILAGQRHAPFVLNFPVSFHRNHVDFYLIHTGGIAPRDGGGRMEVESREEGLKNEGKAGSFRH